MAKKVKSQPMREILHRLTRYPYIHVCLFEENQILDSPVDEWPIVDALLCFYSHAFPLEKAIAYAELRKPYLVNDVKWQRVLLDRRQVYEILLQKSIPVPRFEVFSHIESPQRIVCNDDSIDVNGHTFHKPFVEKPIMADDHNICIYFPSTAGGGSQRLFRKVGDRSSEYVKDGNQVREDGIYIYEEFMATDGTDVKIYTVSEDYAHAEARKCPALDGVVERDHEGKEIRYPVILSPWEKLIAKKIVRAFKQQICGFDLLRTQGQSYVCDVNGFSFVKNSRKYYDDCAHVLAHLLTRHLCPNHFLALHHQPHSTHTHKQHQNQHLHFQHHTHHSPLLNNTPRASIGPIPFDWQGATGGDSLDMDVDESILVDTKGHPMELRCVIAVIRHGDRTPKQKMKMSVRHPRLCQFFIEQGGSMCPARKSRHELKLKQPNQLQRLLDIVHELLHQSTSDSVDEDLCGVKRSDLQQLKLVLELYGHFRGINRKVQMKFQQKSNQSASSTATNHQFHDDDSFELHLANAVSSKVEKKVPPHSDCQDVDGDCVFGDSSLPSTACLLLIAKWGGELTSAGRQQAENLGKAFRRIYPGRGRGLLRLHSTFRHDLKIYASEEGRVQMTAAAFAKGFLALEGDLAPILVQMVKSANTNGLLGCDKKCRKYKAQVKRRMHHRFLTKDAPLTQEDMEHLAPTQSMSLLRALRSIENPVAACHALYEHVKRMFQRVARLAEEQRTSPTSTIYHNESWDLILRRWGKLLEDFCRPSSSVKKCRGDLQTSTGSSTESTSSESTQNGLQENECDARPTFDLSKVLDIYDNIKYDIHHNAHILDLHEAHVFFHRAKALADYLTTQEYGVTVSEKLVIGQRICLQLMRKVLADAQYTEQQDAQHIRLNSPLKIPQAAVSTPGRFVRTRLYFTSESHLHSLLSCLRFGELKDKTKDVRWKKAMDYIDSLSELNYLSQLVVVIYEDPTKHPEQEERFSVEVMFSPGSYPLPRHALPHNLTIPKDDTGNLVGRENVFDEASSSLLTPQSVETCANTSHDFPENTAHKSQFRFILNGFPRHDSTEALHSGQATEAGLRKDSFNANFLEEMTQGDKQSSDGMPLSRNSLSESALAHLEINIGSRSNAEEVPLRMYASSLGEQSILGRLHSSNVQSALPSEHFESITSTSAPQTRTSLRPSFGSVMDPYYAVLRQEMQSPRTGRLISTAVIDPDAEEVASIQATESVDVVTESPVARSITSAPSVEEVYPLETLTNSLTLSQLEDFLMRLTTQKYPTPWSSPRSSETANTTSNNHSDQPLTQQKLLNLFDL